MGEEEEEDDEEGMDVDGAEEEDEIARALAAVKSLGKNQGDKSSAVNDIASRLNELMSGYDEEDAGSFRDLLFMFTFVCIRLNGIDLVFVGSCNVSVPDCIGGGVGNLYYPSNELDPYLQDNDVSYSMQSFEMCNNIHCLC